MKEFWEKCGLNRERWDKLKTHHPIIEDIYKDYKSRSDELNNVAISLSSFLQKMTGVHSVRWRIKSPEHLVAKICRKKEAGIEKYQTISVENYRDVITDLIGIRVLHLLKEDFSQLHGEIISTWDVAEEPIAYLRVGDQQDLRELYEQLGLEVENHADGYRSIHYIILTNFTKNSIKCELQVRTIFEEGWSEIDHKIRYPEFSNEPLVLEFVNIFNRLSGAADEMGTFALKLSNDIEQFRDESAKKDAEAKRIYERLTAKIEELQKAHDKNQSLQKELSEIKRLVQKVRIQDSRISKYSSHTTSKESEINVYTSPHRTSANRRPEHPTEEMIRKLGFSADSFNEVASTSKNSISESVLKRRALEKARENHKAIVVERRREAPKSRKTTEDDQ
jgi:putative GTP pyrophosphokinase